MTSCQVGTRIVRAGACGLLAVAALLLTEPARANSPGPTIAEYGISVEGNQVTICPRGTRPDLELPEGSEMLRREVLSGEVVVLGQNRNDRGCFLDECVPAGQYEYGLADCRLGAVGQQAYGHDREAAAPRRGATGECSREGPEHV